MTLWHRIPYLSNYGFGLHLADDCSKQTDKPKSQQLFQLAAIIKMIFTKQEVSMEAIKTVGLTKRYNNLVAVSDLNLTIQQGELFALLGVNGAGKTTTVKMLSCLVSPTEGDAFVGGYSILQDCLQIKTRIGVSPQETAVAPNLTVKENLELICSFHSFSKEKQRAKIQKLSADFGLEGILHRKAGKLSGGWQRRLSIAMALIGEPAILFLDEPTLGLDVLARHDLWEVIKGLKGNITIILTTHYMDEAEALCDRIGIMKDGKLLVTGTARELMLRTGAASFEDAFIAIVKEG